jgi:hypothetical protein
MKPDPLNRQLRPTTVQIRFCPSGRLTFDEWRPFLRVPERGETLVEGDERYVVVEVDWSGERPFLLAHSYDRPGAQAALNNAQ